MRLHHRVAWWWLKRADRAMRNTFGEPLPVDALPEPEDSLFREIGKSYEHNRWFWDGMGFLILNVLIVVDAVATWLSSRAD